MLRLESVTRWNFSDVIELTVAPEQAGFIVSNAYSLAQAGVQPECVPLAIYAENRPVGFLMYCLNPDDGAWWIYRLMIDARFQGKGYGREALRQLLQLLLADPEERPIRISYAPDNLRAKALYTDMGFVPENRTLHGAAVCRFSPKQQPER